MSDNEDNFKDLDTCDVKACIAFLETELQVIRTHIRTFKSNGTTKNEWWFPIWKESPSLLKVKIGMRQEEKSLKLYSFANILNMSNEDLFQILKTASRQWRTLGKFPFPLVTM